MKRWGQDALTYPEPLTLIKCKWAKKTHNTPLFYILCCVQYFMFKQYRRKQIAELRPIEQIDLEQFEQHKMLVAHKTTDNWIPVSISDADLKAGSPKIGDMVARNPKNHLDQWLVAKQYFEDNFESIQYCTQRVAAMPSWAIKRINFQ